MKTYLVIIICALFLLSCNKSSNRNAEIMKPVTADQVITTWQYSESKDGFSDTITAVARTDSSTGYIIARCKENQFDLYFSVGEYIGSGDGPAGLIDVRYRLDEEPTKTSRWFTSTDGKSVFVSANEDIYLARRMLTSNKLLLEVKDFSGTPHESSYLISNANQSIGKVLDLCKINRTQKVISGVHPELIIEIDKHGPQYTACRKKMLSALGYKISDFSENKTEEYYLASQEHSNKKVKEYCSTNCTDLTHEDTYSDAVKLKPSFKNTCGKLSYRD